MSHQLTIPNLIPILTFESFLVARTPQESVREATVDLVELPRKVEESGLPSTQLVEAAFDTLMSDLTQAKEDALSKHDSTQDATQCMFDQACVLLSQHLERELNGEEQQYTKERCEALCQMTS